MCLLIQDNLEEETHKPSSFQPSIMLVKELPKCFLDLSECTTGWRAHLKGPP
jgi:hypothetical protein